MESLVMPVGNTSKLKALLLAEESCPFDESGGGSSSITNKNNNKINPTNDADKTTKESLVSKRQSLFSTTGQQNRPPPPPRRFSSGTGSTKTPSIAKTVTTETDSTASSSIISQQKGRRNNETNKVVVLLAASGSGSSHSASSSNSLDAVLVQRYLSSPNRSLPDRSNLDVARDKKRILEICYGNGDTETTATTGKQNSEMTWNDGIEVSLKPLLTANEGAKDNPIEKEKRKNKTQKKDKKTKKKKKTSKNVGDMKQTERRPRVKIQGAAVLLQDKDKIHRNNDNIANPQDATETKTKKKITPDNGEIRKKVPPKGTATTSTTTTTVTATASSTARPINTATTTATATATTPTKKKKKTRRIRRVVNRRDAAGRVVRKRLKGKGRDRVVRKDCFRKGRDAKIGLATISEAFYDGLVGTDSDDDDFSDDDEYECSSTSSNEDDEFSSDSNGDNYNDRNETNEVSSTPAGRRRLRSASSSDSPSDVRNTNNHTNPSDEDVPAPTEPGRIVDTIPDTDNTNEGRENSLEESASSVDSTACTSTASAENSRESKSMLCCFGSCRIRTMVFTGMLFVIAVAATTVMVGYFLVFRKDIPSVSSTLAPSSAPNNIGQRPNLRPSQPQSDTTQPSAAIAPTPAPSTSMLNTLSTSCYLPDNKPGTVTAEAEYAPEQFGFATINNSNTGYCGEGYLTILMVAGSGFGFVSFEVNQTGYYKAALRYNNADKAKKALGLLIDDQDEGTFNLVDTGNETSWLVDDIDNVLLREGTHAIRVSVMETDTTIGPSVDWLTLVLQEPMSQFDYLSGLVAQANGMATQTLSQTRTLEWMVNEDSIDYSTLTDQEVIERYALIQIYHSAAGDSWKDNTQWLSELHACGWYGITCSKRDDSNLVTGLMLGTFFDMFFLA
jgi:hypothetical protein